MRSGFDIPIMSALTGDNILDALKSALTPPQIADNREFRAVRAANREPLLRLLPGYNQMTTIYSVINENVDF